MYLCHWPAADIPCMSNSFDLSKVVLHTFACGLQQGLYMGGKGLILQQGMTLKSIVGVHALIYAYTFVCSLLQGYSVDGKGVILS